MRLGDVERHDAANEWQEVTTLAELEALLRIVGGFHDGVLKEVHWVSRNFVRADATMEMHEHPDVRMLVQRQWLHPSAVEMIFEDVGTLRLSNNGFIYDSTAIAELSHDRSGVPHQRLVLEIGESRIVFGRLRWRDASDWMGPETRFGDFVPSSTHAD